MFFLNCLLASISSIKNYNVHRNGWSKILHKVKINIHVKLLLSIEDEI